MSSPQNEYQYDVFISHASEDSAWSEKLAKRLKRAKLRIWIDSWEVEKQPGLTDAINDGLAKSRRFVSVMTKNYLTKGWTNKERSYAINKEAEDREDTFIILIIREECDIPPLLTNNLRIDFRNDFEFNKSCRKLIKALRKTLVVKESYSRSPEQIRATGKENAKLDPKSKASKLSQAGHSVAPAVERPDEPTPPKQDYSSPTKSTQGNEVANKATTPSLNEVPADLKDKNSNPGGPKEPEPNNAEAGEGKNPPPADGNTNQSTEGTNKSSDSNMIPANKEKHPHHLSKGEKWTIGLSLFGILVTILFGIWQNYKPAQSKFSIPKKALTLGDTVFIEQTQGNVREVSLDIKFDEVIFDDGAKFKDRNSRARWSFNLMKQKDIDRFPGLLSEGKHKLEVRYPWHDYWSEIFVLSFSNPELIIPLTPTPLPPQDSAKKESPQFEVSDNHDPDSSFIIRPHNAAAQRLNSPLWVKFDEVKIATPLVPERDRYGRAIWKFSLNAPSQSPLRQPGAHAIKLKFGDSEWSTPYRVRFEESPRSRGVTITLPPPKFVDVNIEYGSSDPELRLRYGIQAGHILSYINGRTAEEIAHEPNLKNDMTRKAQMDLEKLLQNYRRIDIAENPCKPVISTRDGLYEVRPIPTHLTLGSQPNGQPLWLILVFDQGNSPKLLSVEYDQFADWVHLTQDQNPLTPESPEHKKLRDFFIRIENWYNRRDLTSLRTAFVETAEIIVGTRTNGGVQYQTRTKDAYFHKLQNIIERSPAFEVRFSEFVFKRIQGEGRRYLIEFFQSWKTSSYADEGKVRMVVELDFRNNTFIIKRSWQPPDISSDLFRSGERSLAPQGSVQ